MGRPVAVDETEKAEGEEKEKPEVDDEDLPEDDLKRLFKQLAEDGESIPKDNFIYWIQHFMKVVKDIVVTDTLNTESCTTIRRLELNEIAEVLEGPERDDNQGLLRMRVKLLNDDIEGWVTLSGNLGTDFLEDIVLVMKVKKETFDGMPGLFGPWQSEGRSERFETQGR